MKQLVTIVFTLWTALWSEFKDEFDNEKNLFGGSLGNKAAEDLRQKIIEHVSLTFQFSLMVDVKTSLSQSFIWIRFLLPRTYLSYQGITRGSP